MRLSLMSAQPRCGFSPSGGFVSAIGDVMEHNVAGLGVDVPVCLRCRWLRGGWLPLGPREEHGGGVTGAGTTLDLLSLPEGQLVADGSNNDSVALSGWSAITQQY